jgi:DNA polymerase I-like protein with 3'-5' exonuclease and polymerase domains
MQLSARFREYFAAKRQANNSPVQGGSADLVAEAMVKAMG